METLALLIAIVFFIVFGFTLTINITAVKDLMGWASALLIAIERDPIQVTLFIISTLYIITKII